MQETLPRPQTENGEIQTLPPWVMVEASDIEKMHGPVVGVSFRDLGLIQEVGAAIREVIGGGIKGFEKAYTQAYNDAVQKAQEQATILGANSIVNFEVDDEIIRDEDDNVVIKAIAKGVAVTLKENKTNSNI